MPSKALYPLTTDGRCDISHCIMHHWPRKNLNFVLSNEKNGLLVYWFIRGSYSTERLSGCRMDTIFNVREPESAEMNRPFHIATDQNHVRSTSVRRVRRSLSGWNKSSSGPTTISQPPQQACPTDNFKIHS